MTDKKIDPFDLADLATKYKRYGSWVSMGQISEDDFIVYVAATAKRLLENVHKSVNPKGDISLIFNLIPTEESDVFEVTGAWKCFGEPKGENK